MKETQARDCFVASLCSAPRNCGRQSLPWLAQAGGKDNGRIAEALAKAETWVKGKLGS